MKKAKATDYRQEGGGGAASGGEGGHGRAWAVVGVLTVGGRTAGRSWTCPSEGGVMGTVSKPLSIGNRFVMMGFTTTLVMSEGFAFIVNPIYIINPFRPAVPLWGELGANYLGFEWSVSKTGLQC